MNRTPRAVYVHVPFCRRRCGYCNFTLVAGRDDLVPVFLDAIEREMASVGKPHEVETLFLGGGTPTHLRPNELSRLLDVVQRWFPPVSGYEWSIEGNPEDISAETVAVLAAAGVNRLSLGVQSFSGPKLVALEREHSAETVSQAIALACDRFKSLGIDLIFAAPGESLADWEIDLARATALPIHHISTYGLTLERGTSFGARQSKGTLCAAPEDLERSMYETGIDRLEAMGFEHYEVSNFCRPGHRCRHNETYWNGGEYFAFGPGAARYVAGKRSSNHRSVTTWLNRVLSGQSPVAEEETLGEEDRARERMVFGLRQMAGIQAEAFATETGYTLEELGGPDLRKFTDLGLFEWQENRLRLTRAGLLVSDSIWPLFLRS